MFRLSGAPRTARIAAAVFLIPLAVVAATSAQEPAPVAPSGASSAGHALFQLRDVAVRMGLRFRHEGAVTPAKDMPEVVGSGAAWLDFDRDGRNDLYFVNDHPQVTKWWLAPRQDGANALYRNGPDGFARVRRSGTEDRGYGMGTAAADYDNDGWPDLLVTNYGPNRLYRNNGDGTFEPVTEVAGIAGDQWSTSAAWADFDGDGNLDLYIVNYLRYDPETARPCEFGKRPNPMARGVEMPADSDDPLRLYCPPTDFWYQEDTVYRNRGDGSFEDVSVASGVEVPERVGPGGYGLAVAAGDVDDDGDIDVYVANDLTANDLYLNDGAFHFSEEGLMRGVALGREGFRQASMGVEMVDLDGDGRFEIIAPNYQGEPYALYHAEPGGDPIYAEASEPFGLALPTTISLGFGVVAADLDGDGDAELAFANGHVQEQAARFAQGNQLLLNLAVEQAQGDDAAGPLLRDISAVLGRPLTRKQVSRGIVAGDADGDGVPEILVTNFGARPQLLQVVEVDAPVAHRLVLRLRGRASNRDAIGARVTVRVVLPGQHGGREWTQIFEVRAGSSYLSQNAADLYVGLGQATTAHLQIRWPDGSTETLQLGRVDRLLLLGPGEGIVASRALR